MNKIQTLIQQHCPNGVEFKTLGEVGSFYGGLTRKSKKDFSDGNAKFITYMNVFSNIAVNTEIEAFVRVGENETQNRVELGDVLFTGSSETPNECGMSSVLTKRIDEPLYLNSFCFGFRLHDINMFLPDFLKYLFRDNNLREQIIKTASGVIRFNISKQRMKEISIPIPPLAVQQEVASILDKFTELEAALREELAAELKARKKQYEYYRNKLLTFDETAKDVQWMKLGEICIKTGNIKWKEVSSKEFLYIDLSSVNRDNNQITETQVICFEDAPSRAQQIVRAEDVIFGTTRPTLKRFCFITPKYDGQICSTGFCVLRANKDVVLPKYLFFILTTVDFYNYVENYQEGAGYPSITNSKVFNYRAGIPPLQEQARIVAILDKFDALVNDLSIGLPAEIAARRKQYEYYRNQLLCFDEIAGDK